MLKVRVIPCLDVDNGRVVKGVNFVDLVDAGDPVEQAKLYCKEGADELCFLDITATSDQRKTILETIAKVAEEVFIPLTVGGGVRTLEDIRALLEVGVDKVAINSAAIKDPDFVRRASDKYGSQAIVVAIDAKEEPDQENKWGVYSHGGRKPVGMDAVVWARQVADLGAGELLVTSMDRDGTRSGFDIDLLKAITSQVSVPVIASGGVGVLDHLVEGVRDGGASAVLAASIFHFGDHTINQSKLAISDAGLPARVLEGV